MSGDLILLQRRRARPVRRFVLSEGRFILGRATDCNIIVEHPTVSRRHCEIWVSSGRIRIFDLGSRNGTFIDETPVHKCPSIREGQYLRCGDVSFTLCLDHGDQDADESTKDCEESDIVSPAPTRISAAQNRVFQQLLRGLSDKEIAHELKISPKTVHQHVQAIFRTMGVHSRPELLASFIQIEREGRGMKHEGLR